MENIPRHASITAGQYFYVVNLKNAWQITGQPTWAYNHNADKGSRFTFPIGTGVNKVTKFGKLPVKLTMQYWYYVASSRCFWATTSNSFSNSTGCAIALVEITI